MLSKDKHKSVSAEEGVKNGVAVMGLPCESSTEDGSRETLAGRCGVESMMLTEGMLDESPWSTSTDGDGAGRLTVGKEMRAQKAIPGGMRAD